MTTTEISNLPHREVLGDECAIDGCPYEHKETSKYCGLNHVCEDCGSQLVGDDIGYCTCKPCFDQKHAENQGLTTEVAEAIYERAFDASWHGVGEAESALWLAVAEEAIKTVRLADRKSTA